jgi:hypothetical protein
LDLVAGAAQEVDDAGGVGVGVVVLVGEDVDVVTVGQWVEVQAFEHPDPRQPGGVR